jgi:hypothetical protein
MDMQTRRVSRVVATSILATNTHTQWQSCEKIEARNTRDSGKRAKKDWWCKGLFGGYQV